MRKKHTKSLSAKLAGALPYTLTNDYLFHIVFQRDEKLLKSLLCSLLDLKEDEIIDVKLENPIYPGDTVDDKEIILDLMITLNHNRKINIELQVSDFDNWPERSLTYLCRSFDDAKRGQNYKDLLPMLHISILDFTLFQEHPEFYARYCFTNTKTHTIYSDKLALNVLDLSRPDLATEEDITSGRQHWSKLFKAKTWEEIKMLASNNKMLESVSETMAEALADKEIRLRCEARRRYEEDKLSAYSSGHQKGLTEGMERGRSEGLSEGQSQEQNNFTALIQKMNENGEAHLLPKLSDLDFLKEMYQKYRIQ